MDALRVALARSLWAMSLEPESNSDVEEGARGQAASIKRGAFTLLRDRAAQGDPSPHLLRGLSELIYREQHFNFDLAEGERGRLHEESIALLRRAYEDERDPQRDMTVYNLMSALGGRDTHDPDKPIEDEPRREADELLHHLLQSDSGYKRTWYVRHAAGARAWEHMTEVWRRDPSDPEVAALAREAAKWYVRALRARPKLQIRGIGLRPPFIYMARFPSTAQIPANLVDAHLHAGHRFRAWWYERRFQHRRRRYLRRAQRRFSRGEWMLAHANFDWATVGRDDFIEMRALVYSAVSAWLGERRGLGKREWKRALEMGGPVALDIRMQLAEELSGMGIDDPVPGDETTDPEEIDALIAEMLKGQEEGTDGEDE